MLKEPPKFSTCVVRLVVQPNFLGPGPTPLLELAAAEATSELKLKLWTFETTTIKQSVFFNCEIFGWIFSFFLGGFCFPFFFSRIHIYIYVYIYINMYSISFLRVGKLCDQRLKTLGFERCYTIILRFSHAIIHCY